MLRNAKDTQVIQNRGKVSGQVIELKRARLCRFRDLLLPLVGGLCVIFLGSSPAKAGTPIPGGPCTVPVIITMPGEYSLAGDLGPCAGDGIWIQVSKVTLHLEGHTITGTDATNSAGIRVESIGMATTVTDVRIKGPGVVTNFKNGLVTRNSADSQMKQVTVIANSANGVLVGFAAPPGAIQSHWQFVGNTVTGNDFVGFGAAGIALVNTTDCIVVQNDVSNNGNGNIGDGIFVQQDPNSGNGVSSDNNVVSNTANGNSGNGIHVLSGSVDNLITANRAASNGSLDLRDDNANCDSNKWQGNKFGTANQPCIR